MSILLRLLPRHQDVADPSVDNISQSIKYFIVRTDDHS